MKGLNKMSMVKVKSHTKSGNKVSPYTRSSSSSSNRVGDCSLKGVAKKFKEIRGKTSVKSEASTGNKFVDKVILPKIPLVGKYIKAYNFSHDTMADVARVKATYDETCKKKK